MGEFFGELLRRFLVYFVLLPVLFVVSTPFILTLAVFGPGTYSEGVRRGYSRVFRLWDSLCI